MLESSVSIIIPHERIGVLIGKDGEVKSEIERSFNVKLSISGETGLVEIFPKEGNEDPTSMLRAREAALAIGRGFSPEKALALRDEDIVLDIVDLRQLFGKNEGELRRVRGRVIGSRGKFRRLIEEMSGAKISVYGHTIGFLGEFDAVSVAREAVEQLLKGKQHSSVYRFLRRARSEAKRRKALEIWERSAP